jgi:putative polyhydroxyalkanoate system protein
MAKVEFEHKHSLGREEAVARAKKIVEEVKKQFGAFVQDFAWNKDETSAKASGKGFSAEVHVEDQRLRILVDLPGLMGMALAPKVESKMKEMVTRFFS